MKKVKKEEILYIYFCTSHIFIEKYLLNQFNYSFIFVKHVN